MNSQVSYRPFEDKDIPEAAAIYRASYEAGETLYRPLSCQAFERAFLRPGALSYSAVCGDKLVGFVQGMLTDESGEDSPGYLSVVMVAAAYRRRGIGRMLIQMLLAAIREKGKRTAECGWGNPLNLSWMIPETPGHDHNKIPGVPVNSQGYHFLRRMGFEVAHEEIAMYMALKDYAWQGHLTAIQGQLAQEGVTIGRYDPKLGYEFDGMCDRVNSEYWRRALRAETIAWLTGTPCADSLFWADGVRPKSPRTILAATCGKHVVGFTGPVDLQLSGRGWFTGICVDPLYGRRSIGEILFNLLICEFIQIGATFTTLHTTSDNPAQRIYRRAGLRVVERFAVMSKRL